MLRRLVGFFARLLRRAVQRRIRQREVEEGIRRATGETSWERTGRPLLIDGDTLELRPTGIRVRLARIDAPEMDTPEGERAARALYDRLAEADDLSVRIREEGKYGRAVAEVEADGVNVSDWMLEEGLAERY